MGAPKAPKPTTAQLQEESDQVQASALLDQQENERRKRLLNAAAGMRVFAGSALTRAAPSNTSAQGAPSAAQVVGMSGSIFSNTGGTGSIATGGSGRAGAKPA